MYLVMCKSLRVVGHKLTVTEMVLTLQSVKFSLQLNHRIIKWNKLTYCKKNVLLYEYFLKKTTAIENVLPIIALENNTNGKYVIIKQ